MTRKESPGRRTERLTGVWRALVNIRRRSPKDDPVERDFVKLAAYLDTRTPR